MDKYEYKVRSDEIKRLAAAGDYAQAAEIADTIDWRRVRSVMMLCMVSDLYKINRRYEDAKNMLLLAYERRPGGRTICYSLCELCIKTEDFLQAVNYYKEFVQAAPRDPGRYILQYKIYEAQDVSLEERIGVLEELKKRDYREKWAYELAYLYHRVGLATRCVEECDELILWFGSGKYVVKAMELKMLHQPLTTAQQDAYDHRYDQTGEELVQEEESADGEGVYVVQEEDAGYVGEDSAREEGGESQSVDWGAGGEDMPADRGREDASDLPDEMDIQVKTLDVGKFNTINLQEELAAGLQEVLGAEEERGSQAASGAEMYAEEAAEDFREDGEGADEDLAEPEEEDGVEVFFGETGEIRNVSEELPGAGKDDDRGDIPAEESGAEKEDAAADKTGQLVMEQMREEAAEGGGEQTGGVHPPRELAGVLSQEADGQIRLVVPESSVVEKQITGQMKIDDILSEWERMKKESEEKCRENVRRHVQQQTGPMFTEFDAAVRDGLLEQLEAERAEEAGGPYGETGEGRFGKGAAAEESEGKTDGIKGAEFAEREYGNEASEENPEYIDAYGEDDCVDADAEDMYREEESCREESEDGEPYGEESYIEESEGGEPCGEEPYSEEPDGEESYGEEPYIEESEGGEPCGEEPDGEESYWEEAYIEEADDEAGYEEDTDEDDIYIDEDIYIEDADTEAGYGEAADEDIDAEEAHIEEKGMAEGEQENAGAEDVYIEDICMDELNGEEESDEEAGGRRTGKGAPKEKPVRHIRRKAEDSSKDVKETVDPEKVPVERDQARVRALTREERELYAPFIQSRRSREQLVKAIDNISMAAYTGNIVITGEEGMDTLVLAKNMIREVQMADSNFSGKVAKISGKGLNQRDVRKTLEEMKSGALIIYAASGMSGDTARALYRALQQEMGIIVVLEDTKKAVQKLFLGTPELVGAFTARMDLEALSNDTLVLFGKRYAREMEHSIDELGILALHTRIEELQTIDHVVTVVDVKKIVDDAIRHAGRKTLGHFFDVLFARRYDDEDMIILTEKDFVA